MRARAIFPGAMLAGALTAAALLALVLTLAIRGDGPFPLGLGDSGGSAQLSVGERAAPAGHDGRQAAPIDAAARGAPRGVAAPAPGVARLGGVAAAPRATTRGERVAIRPTLRTPARRTPSVAPAPTAAPPATGTTTDDRAQPAGRHLDARPGRGQGPRPRPPAGVARRPRCPSPASRPGKPAAPRSSTPVPAPAPRPRAARGRAPPVEKHRVDPPGQVRRASARPTASSSAYPRAPAIAQVSSALPGSAREVTTPHGTGHPAVLGEDRRAEGHHRDGPAVRRRADHPQGRALRPRGRVPGADRRADEGARPVRGHDPRGVRRDGAGPDDLRDDRRGALARLDLDLRRRQHPLHRLATC